MVEIGYRLLKYPTRDRVELKLRSNERDPTLKPLVTTSAHLRPFRSKRAFVATVVLKRMVSIFSVGIFCPLGISFPNNVDNMRRIPSVGASS
jgi:hypothetical protein